MKKFKIEKNIPILKDNRGNKRKYPFKEMKIGDSFIIYNEYSRENMSKYLTAAINWSKKGNHGYKFAVRKTEDNKIRIWRIA